ncbi:MAG: beta strand repeat-containing protein, partial [Planctomycetota bacterium]
MSITFNASLTNGGMDGSPLVVTSTKTSGTITGNLTSATATTRISVTGSGGAGDNVVFTAYDAPAAALDFDANLSLLDINGNVTCASLACSTVSNLGGNVISTGIQAYGGASTLTSTISLNSNGNTIQFGSTVAGGGNNLTLASGIGAGTVDFIGGVGNLGSGTGAALTVAAGVTGQVHFNSTLAGNSGIVSNGGSNLRFDGNVSLGNGDTATSLAGISLFNAVAFSGFDGLGFGTLQLATGASSLDSNGSAIQVGSLSGPQNLTLASGIGAGTTTVSGPVSNLGSGIGAALAVSSGVTGLVRFQSVVGANSGISATSGSSLRFDDNVTLGNGDTATSLAGNVQLDGLSLSGYDGITMNAVTLSGAGVTLNSNGGAIQMGTLTGAQNLSLAAGIGSGTTTVTGTVTNLGSGTGAALFVASGVTGLVRFQNTLGANSGLIAAAGTQCQLDGNTTLGNGDTASSFSGILTLDGLSLSAFDGITVNTANLSTAAVSLQSTAGNISLGSINGAQALTLDSGSANDTLVLGMVGNLAAPTGLTVSNASTAYFYDKVTVGGPILINNATLNVAFGETVLASSITSL